MLFVRDASGKITGLTRIAKDGRQQFRDARTGALRRVGFGSPMVADDCAEATIAAAAALASAVAVCALGLIEACIAATAPAAVAAKKAYDACKGPISDDSGVV